jgi:hypothetical protein
VADGIPYRDGLVQSLERSLRSGFNQPHLRLTRKPGKPGGGFGISLETGDKIAQTDDGRDLPVMGISIEEDKESAFYFGFVATFEIQASGYALQHASVSVFQDIFAGDLAPLFRAEWDQKAAADTTSEHAQPHWHFVQSPDRIGSIVRTLINPPREFSSEPEGDIFAGIADCGKIHFAMTSLLGEGAASSHKQLFDASDFPKWFANLTKYIAAQIAYIISKAPPGPITEFVPVDN